MRALALILLTSCCAAFAGASLGIPFLEPWGAFWGACLAPGALLMLAASARQRGRRLIVLLAAGGLTMTLAAGLLLALLAPTETALPLVFVLAGVWLLPLAFLPILHAFAERDPGRESGR